MLDITAAAIKQFKEVLTESGETNHGIRVFVSGDGCCSSYGLDASEHGEPGDKVIEKDGLKIFIDPAADNELSNATIDYENGFMIRGISSSCCG